MQGKGQVSTTAMDLLAAGHRPAASTPLIVLSGPSGVGKDTVLRHLRRTARALWVSVSATTRAPRPGEKDGVNYHFLSDEAFDRMIAEGGFLEWADFVGNRYGTPRAPVEDRLLAGTPVLLEIELQGARQIRAALPQAMLVFLAPPSWDELVRRITSRGTESPEEIQRRLAVARTELAAEAEFDITLTNTSVPEVADQLVALVTSRASTDRTSPIE